ncbi:hypothetical protein C9417_07370 [Rhizobium sp. SEMIA 4088]|nr:hypothetical protein C9417_07370 [Rhizobium sp. SEMIA 4088]
MLHSKFEDTNADVMLANHAIGQSRPMAAGLNSFAALKAFQPGAVPDFHVSSMSRAIVLADERRSLLLHRHMTSFTCISLVIQQRQ